MDKKKYLLTGLTLAIIAGSSGLIIGLTNLATKDRIAENEKNTVLKGIDSIFGEGSKITKEEDVEDYKYINHTYLISDNSDNEVGYVFRTTGSNQYGKISLLVGFAKEDLSFKNIYLVVDEQSFATTLEDNYVAKIQDGSRDIDDVKCGATYGATLVKNMINEAKEAVEVIYG